MKVLVLTLLCIAFVAAVPVELQQSDDNTKLTLADIENDPIADENGQDAARSKRFILKKIALAKAGALGIGALGIAVAAKSGFGGGIGNSIGGGQPSAPPQNYGYGYNYNTAPLTTSYPSAAYYSSQNTIPSTYTTGYNTDTTSYGVAPSVATGHVGYAAAVGPSYPVQSQYQAYGAYRAAPAPALLPPQGKSIYVVCDRQ